MAKRESVVPSNCCPRAPECAWSKVKPGDELTLGPFTGPAHCCLVAPRLLCCLKPMKGWSVYLMCKVNLQKRAFPFSASNVLAY